MPVFNRRNHANMPQVFKSSTLNILTLDTNTTTPSSAAATEERASSSSSPAAAAGKPKVSPSPSGTKVPTSWQGFTIKTDERIRSDAQKRWADLDYSPLVSRSPFEGIRSASGKGGIKEMKDIQGEFPAAVNQDQQEEEVPAAALEVTPSPSTPTKFEEEGLPPAEVPLKPGEEDADGAESFEEPAARHDPYNGVFQEQQQQQQQYQPQYYNNNYHPSTQPQQQYLDNHVPSSGGFIHHQHYDAARQYQSNNVSFPTQAPTHPEEGTYQSGQDSALARPANHELLGFLPFYKYDSSVWNDLPTAEEIGGDVLGPSRAPKLFFGHVWSRVPTGVVQWLVSSFGAPGSVAFEPQLHFSREGCFKGCLHASVETNDPRTLIHSLHKRVLFDHQGVWFAETPDQVRILEDYCKRLRALPMQIRHSKLQSLPCNALACELARNE